MTLLLSLEPITRYLKERDIALVDLFPCESYVDESGQTRQSIVPEYETQYDTWMQRLHRAAKTGLITDQFVDEFCIDLLGVHPVMLYPDWQDIDPMPIDMYDFEELLDKHNVTKWSEFLVHLAYALDAVGQRPAGSAWRTMQSRIFFALFPEYQDRITGLPQPVQIKYNRNKESTTA